MIYAVLVVGMIGCAVFAMRATRLLEAALWLAGVSAMTAIILYQLGAFMMAVIELSLSVGLITILLVFAISMSGADSPDQPVWRWLNIPLMIIALGLVIGLAIPSLLPQTTPLESSFKVIFWDLRQADVLVQIALIFAGAVGILGLLAEPSPHTTGGEPHQTQVEGDQGDDLNLATSPEYEPEPEMETV